MSNVVQSQTHSSWSHGGCSSTICYCFAAVKTKAALAGTGRTTEQTLLMCGCISLLLFSQSPVVFLYIDIDRYYKYCNVWERYVKKKKVSEPQMALGTNRSVALRLPMCRKESGLGSPRTRQRSPTSVSGGLCPPGIPRCSCFPQIWFSCSSDFPKRLLGILQNWFKALCCRTMSQAIARRKRLAL